MLYPSLSLFFRNVAVSLRTSLCHLGTISVTLVLHSRGGTAKSLNVLKPWGPWLTRSQFFECVALSLHAILALFSQIKIEPVALSLGAEISGVDLTRPLSPEVFDVVEKALVAHQVIFFRDQNLTPEAHKAFAKLFRGKLQVCRAILHTHCSLERQRVSILCASVRAFAVSFACRSSNILHFPLNRATPKSQSCAARLTSGQKSNAGTQVRIRTFTSAPACVNERIRR
jgi:hypothetical protein